jgi:hypothetical protein
MGFTYQSGGASTNTLSVPGGYEILYDSGAGVTEANPETGPMATVKYKVNDANQRYSFAQQLLGYSTGAIPVVTYFGPYAYPPSPNLICTAIPSIESLGKWLPMSWIGAPWFFGKSAIVTAVFTRPQWQAATSAGYFSINYQSAGEYLTLPNTTYRFGDGTPTNTPIGLHVSQQNIIVTRYRMPFLPDAYAMPLLDTLNNAPFTIGWNTYPAGTLMFGGMNNDVTSDPLGNIIFTVQYLFQYRSINWNWDFHPNRTTGWALVTDGNGAPRYASGNFGLLP